MNYAESIKAKRKQLGLRQIDLAIKLGVSEAQVSKYETGRIAPSFEIAQLLSEVLGIKSPSIKQLSLGSGKRQWV